MDIPIHIILSSISALFPFLAGLFVFKNLGKELKLIFTFFSIAVLFDVAFCVMALNQIRNLWLFHIYTLVEFGFWMFYFSYQFNKSKLNCT